MIPLAPLPPVVRIVWRRKKIKLLGYPGKKITPKTAEASDIHSFGEKKHETFELMYL